MKRATSRRIEAEQQEPRPERATDASVVLTPVPEAITRDAEQLSRIQTAVRSASALRHDHIVPVLDLAEEAGGYHVVEASPPAQPLDQVLKAGALAATEALHVVRQLADALAYAHDRGVVHGAIVPANVRFEQGAPPRALLAGFGTAMLTPATALVPYVAPERLAGSEPDFRADVFALGLLLFEMLEGRPFFSGGEREVTALLLERKEPLLPRFSRIAPTGVSALVARAIRRAPGHRHQSMLHLREDIDECLRRLGERRWGRAVAVLAPDGTPRPRKLVVVDEALEDLADADADPSADERPAEPVRETRPARVAARAPERTAGQSAPMAAGRVAREPGVASWMPSLGRALGVAGFVAGGVAVVALGWHLLRPAPSVPPEPARTAAPVVEAPVVAAADAPAAPAAEPAVPSEHSVPSEPAVTELPAAQTAAAVPAIPEAPADAEPARNVAPRIVSHLPRQDPLQVVEGQGVEFSVQATDQNADDALAYAWFLDGRRVSGGTDWRFVAPLAATATAHIVEAQVSDGSGLRAPRVTWRVQVVPRMSEVNAREWLDRLAAAWQRQDVATLRLYGVVTGDEQAAALRTQLSRYDGYRVTFTDPIIRTEGPYASVAVDRTVFDGQKLVSSGRESYRLEKDPSGFVRLRPR